MSQHESSMSSRYGYQVSPDVMESKVRSYLGQRYQSLEEMVSNHPATSALVVFGVGVGLGVMLGSAIGMATAERSRSRWISSRQAERFGRRILDAIGEHLPESITSRLG